jgi:hypothetical protein
VVARDRDRALATLDELGTVRGQLESEGGR